MDNRQLNEVYLFHLEKAYKQFRKRKTEFFKQAGIDITSDQWVLLKSIEEEEGINQQELARKAFKEPASVTRILDILEKKGWVRRQAMENNRRAYALFVTEQGKALVQRILPLAAAIRAEGVAGMSEEEEVQLRRLLIRLYENFS